MQAALLWITVSITGLHCGAGRVVDAVVDCAERKRGDGWRHYEFQQSDCGHCSPIATGYIVTVTRSYSGAFVAAAIVLAIGIAAYVLLWVYALLRSPIAVRIV
jgi:hypothetical protein